MGEAIFFGLLFLFVVVIGPWIVAASAARRARRAAGESQDNYQRLDARCSNLELTIRELRKEISEIRARTAAPAEAPQPVVERVQTATASAPPKIARAAPTAPPVQASPAGPVAPISQVPAAIAETQPRAAVPHQPTPLVVATSQASTSSSKPHVGLEEKLGTNWLNKVGIVLLVLGVAFLLSTLMQTLGPAGKVLIGFAISGALLAAGVFFEKHEQYRILARAGIGGGWALLFFTTYAMNHVAAARVISSPGADAFLMLIVAAAMVAHTLRYDSQVVTGLAFLLALGTVTISTLDRVDVYSLSAGIVLALAIAAIALRRQWYELEVFGILATYFNHYLWLRPIIEPMGEHHHPFPEFGVSAAMLLGYWLIFRVSYMVRRVDDAAFSGSADLPGREQVSTIAALLNTGLLLAVLKYQSLHPEWAAWALLTLGAIEMTCAVIARRRRRMAFVILATVGSALMVAALPFHFSGTSVSLLWLLEGETLFLAGIATREIVFRRLGLLVTIPIVADLFFVHTQRLTVEPDGRLGIVFAFAALIFYFDAHVAQRRWPELFSIEIDLQALQAISYAASLLALMGCWVALPDAWTAVSWAAVGLLLAFTGRRFAIAELTNAANVLAAAAVLRALVVNIEVEGVVGRIGLRALTLVCIAALLYLTAPWTSADGKRRQVPQAYTWAASFLMGLLCWYELQPLNVALGWVLLGLILFEVGIALERTELRFQAYAAFAAGFLRVFFVNLNAVPAPGELSPRIYSTLPLALIFLYAYWRLDAVPRDHARFARDRGMAAAALVCYFGVIIIAALVRFELAAEWVAAGWAAMSLALVTIAWRSRRRLFLDQALLMSLAVLFRALFFNFAEASYFGAAFGNGRFVTVGVAAAILFATLPVAFRTREMGRYSEQVFWFVPLTMITVLLALEARRGMITVAWGVEGVIAFLLALMIGERSYRLSGLGLLLLCVGKIVVVDVWELSSTDRYVTFIAMGAALLLVSFLYSRYRDALRQYL